MITLKEARIERGLTQMKLADLSGVNIRQIRRVELGTSDAGNMSARNLLAIADVLGVEEALHGPLFRVCNRYAIAKFFENQFEKVSNKKVPKTTCLG